VLAAACGGSPGGPHYAQIGISASTGTAVLTSECLPLPVLPGGTIDDDIELAPTLSAHVFLVRDYADVSLEGTNDPYSAHVELPLQTLLAGYVKDLNVTTLDGKSYVVTLTSPCDAAM
jgi:hypothetical protein